MIERFVRWLLLAYPAETRERYGDEIAETVVERVRRARCTARVLGAAPLVVRECVGVLVRV